MTDELLVKLQMYEGPLDLLLHLIKKNEVDLDDVPVALITAQYLEYLDLMESLNVEMAADFLVMAATLAQIKSRLLLPREDGDDPEADPEAEFKAAVLDPLLEHLRRGAGDFSGAAEALRHRQILDSDVFVRGGSPLEEDPDAPDEPLAATLFDLVDAFRRLSEKKERTRTLEFVVERKTLAERLVEIRTFLKDRKRGFFEDICAGDRDKGEVVLSFLAILELARIGFLRLYQASPDRRAAAPAGDGPEAAPGLELFLADPEAEVGDAETLGY